MPVNNPSAEKIITTQPFRNGQMWRLENSNVLIGEVGKTLVEYKVLKGHVNRGPIRLIGKLALQDLLKVNRAILVQ